MIGEGDAAGHVQACSHKPGKELVRARDAAEGNNRTIDGWHLHAAVKTPDRAIPALSLGVAINQDGFVQIAHGLLIVKRDGEDRCAVKCFKRLAEVSSGQKPVFDIGRTEKKNVDVAMKLAMLEAVVEEMDIVGRG
jgi:hypothetical protein